MKCGVTIAAEKAQCGVTLILGSPVGRAADPGRKRVSETLGHLWHPVENYGKTMTVPRVLGNSNSSFDDMVVKLPPS